MKKAIGQLLVMSCICCVASVAYALSWPQQAGEYTRDAFQTANNFQVVTGLASSLLSLTYSTQAASSNTLVVDENNAYWATSSGALHAVQLSTGTMAWPSAPPAVVNGQVQLPSGVWHAPVLVGTYLVVPSEASLYVFQRATRKFSSRMRQVTLGI
jgi:outer membrane protein assembly factor BamB